MTEIALKIVVVGDEAVGKTSIILRYTKNRFTENYKPTLGADFALKEVKYNKLDVKLYLWDIGGSNRYKNLYKYYFEGANLFLLVFDISSTHSFENVKQNWLINIQEYSNSVPIILVANKYDLKNQREVTLEEIKYLISEPIILSFEISAKTNYNIENLFSKSLEILVLT